MPALNEVVAERLAASDEAHLRRRLIATRTLAHGRIQRGGKQLRHFCSNDYLGLARHPLVCDALAQATVVGSGASRLVSGNHSAYARLEQALATHKAREAALVFGSGYAANLGVIPALVGAPDLVLADKWVHASMMDAMALSQATCKRFAHNDLAHLERLLEQHRGQYRHCLILSESIFSMDGDRSDIPGLLALKARFDAWLMMDDAHGLYQQPAAEGVDIWLGTLSKALGCYGAYVAGSQLLIDYLTTQARSLIYSTALPEALVEAAYVALNIAISEPERARRTLAHAQQFAQVLGLPAPESAIIPLVLGEAGQALEASQALEAEGFFVQANRPPTVPKGTARLRFTFSADHAIEDIDDLVKTIQKLQLVPCKP